MSEGQVFFSLVPNITMHLPGVKPVEFKNGRYPKRKDEVCTDPQIISALKASPEYPSQIISEEDKVIRNTPDPKMVEDLLSKAMESLKEIPGVIPSELMPSPSPKEASVKSPEPASEQSEPLPSLTEVSRMKKDDLMNVAEALGLDLNESETAAILKRAIRSAIKQSA